MSRRPRLPPKTQWLPLPHVVHATLIARCPDVVAKAHESYYRAEAESGNGDGPLKRRPREAHVQRTVEFTSEAGLDLTTIQMRDLCGAPFLACECAYCQTREMDLGGAGQH